MPQAMLRDRHHPGRPRLDHRLVLSSLVLFPRLGLRPKAASSSTVISSGRSTIGVWRVMPAPRPLVALIAARPRGKYIRSRRIAISGVSGLRPVSNMLR